MTNGEIIKTIFPNEEMYEQTPTMTYYGMMRFDTDWWNAEYKEPTTKNNLGVDKFDKAINQSDLEEWIMETFPDWCEGDVRLIMNHMDEMPSVTPQEPRKGHWISRWYAGHDLHFHVCSECNEEFSCDMETGISIDNYRYCPNCGCRMVDPQKSEDV